MVSLYLMTGCSTLSTILPFISGGNSPSSGNKSLSINTDLQSGDRDYKGIGGSVKTSKNNGTIAGNNQNNYSASKLTVNQDSFWKTLISFILGFVLCGIATFLAGLYLPQPKHLQKLKSYLKSKRT